MPRLIRYALILATIAVSSQAFACTYSAKGMVNDGGRRSWKFRVRNAPCVDQQPVAVAPQYAPPPVYVQPAPAGVLPMPVYANARIEKPVDDRPSLLAVKYAPGASSPVSFESKQPEFGGIGFAHSVGIEVRLSRWFALRSDFEMRNTGRSWDMVGLKVSLPWWALKQYGSVSLSGSEALSFPGKYQLGMSAALGVDLTFGKHFFIEAEARYRVSPTSECCREVPTLTGLIGAGVAFF
jgi:hypothetical protein